MPVIHLTRDDQATAISNIRLQLSVAERGASHVAHVTSRDSVPTQFKYVPAKAEIDTWSKRIAGWRAAALQRVAGNARTISIDYDEITGGDDIRVLPNAVARRLCEFLTVPIHPMSVDIVKSS
ncbi:MAG TPA: hypothetical protein VMW68_05735 [Methyloceanibacter sp.]|nr:hypothetical protein [Methyloceanibacter sp.]